MVAIDSLRRSLLFVPGAEPRKLERARTAGADTLIFDLEDAVAVDRKALARQQVVDALRSGGFGATELAVRVNAPSTPFFAEDVAAVVAGGAHAIVLPKAEHPDGLRDAEAVVAAAEQSSATRAPVRLMALVESALGIVEARSLCTASARIDALCFGHADFSLDMGLTDADAAHGVVLHARCTVAIAAKAGGVTAVDSVCLALNDDAAFRADAQLGRSLGFDGKLCIHPAQVAIANQVHSPTPEQIAYAERVVAGWREANAAGRGVLSVDNKMIDAPLVAAQRRLLARAQRVGLWQGTLDLPPK